MHFHKVDVEEEEGYSESKKEVLEGNRGDIAIEDFTNGPDFLTKYS